MILTLFSIVKAPFAKNPYSFLLYHIPKSLSIAQRPKTRGKHEKPRGKILGGITYDFKIVHGADQYKSFETRRTAESAAQA
jgi:hypothetical protein